MQKSSQGGMCIYKSISAKHITGRTRVALSASSSLWFVGMLQKVPDCAVLGTLPSVVIETCMQCARLVYPAVMQAQSHSHSSFREKERSGYTGCHQRQTNDACSAPAWCMRLWLRSSAVSVRLSTRAMASALTPSACNDADRRLSVSRLQLRRSARLSAIAPWSPAGAGCEIIKTGIS